MKRMAAQQDQPRIGIDVTASVTQGGGIGRYTRELVRALVEVGGEHTYHLFHAKPPKRLPVADPLPKGDNVVCHGAPLTDRWLYRLWYRLRLPLPVQLLTGKLDLFHSPDFVLPPVGGNIPTLLTVHDLSFVHYPKAFTPALTNYLYTVVPWSIGRATHIVADSRATKEDLIKFWKVDPVRITVIYSGVGSDFRPVTAGKQIAQVREKYDLGQTPYLLSVGTLQPRKNYQMLIRAFAPVAARYPHSLVIAGGKGWLFDQILAEATRLGIEDRVRFVGFVDDADLAALYSEATLFVFPSLYEGFGLPLLEAMACGVPVLSANASSLPEVAGEAALLLPPHGTEEWTGSMIVLLDDPSRRTQMVANGFRQARQFTWHKAAKQLLSLYEQLLEAGSKD